ncbi:hypothetical protein DPSP01_014749 [Paraphaeosphaeria sporulosa]
MLRLTNTCAMVFAPTDPQSDPTGTELHHYQVHAPARHVRAFTHAPTLRAKTSCNFRSQEPTSWGAFDLELHLAWLLRPPTFYHPPGGMHTLEYPLLKEAFQAIPNRGL